MKISKLEITNFRSIKHLVIEPEGLCALVGPNSVGKTNVLKAIDLVIGEGWTTKAKIARELFNDVTQPIKISIDFDMPVEFQGIDRFGTSHPQSVSNVTLTMEMEPELDVKTSFNGTSAWYQDEFKKHCHFVYIPASRDLSDQMRVSNWTLLGKMMKLIYENYIHEYGDENLLKQEFSSLMEEPKNFLEADFNADPKVVTYKNFVDTFKTYCSTNSAGLANDFQPQLNIYNLNWFYKTLQIHIKEDGCDKTFDAEEVGAGMQNLLLISIFQTYAKLMGGKVIFGIEEPEIFLYPQAQRSLYKSFQELSINTQIFYTTHCQNFVDAYRAYEIELLRKTPIEGTINTNKNLSFLTPENAESEKFKIYTQFNTARNEIFFAKKVILVEGDSDKILLSTIVEKKFGVDLDSDGISIISCNGKGGVNYFVGVCSLLGMSNYFSVWDSDDEDYRPSRNNLPAAIAAGTGIEIPGNIESYLKITGSTSDKVENAYNWAILVEPENIPDLIWEVGKFVGLTDEKISELRKLEIPAATATSALPF